MSEGSGSNDGSRITRRKTLAIGGLGVAAAVAGCSSDSGGTPTQTEGSDDSGDEDTDTETDTDMNGGEPFIEGQEFRVPTDTDPLETTFLGFANWDQEIDTQYEADQPTPMKDPTVWGLFKLHEFQNELGREGEGRLFADWEFNIDHEASEDNPQYIEVTLRENANWSDGEPITAWDLYVNAGIKRLNVQTNDNDENSFHASSGGNDLRNAWDYMEMPDGEDGKRVRFVSEGLGMGLGDQTVSNFLGFWNGGRLELNTPAHHEDIQPMAAEVEQALDDALENPTDLDAWDTRKEILQRHIDQDMAERWRDPDVVVSSGAWRLEEVRGSQEIRLEKNPHYRNADQVNFDRVTIEYTPEAPRQHAAIQSGILDYGQVSMTQAAVDSLPDKYEQVNGVGSGPGVIQFNHAHWAFQHLEVRQAIAYAIDQDAVANNVNPAATDPIDYPGAEVANHDFVWSDEEIEETFIDYSQDLDTADSLMQEAGFERNSDGVWENEDGEALSFTFHTDTNDPVYEQTVADQLNQWGCDVQVQTLDEADYEERMDGGELNFYAKGGDLNHHIGGVDAYWGTGLLWHRDSIHHHNIYDQEKMEEIVSQYGDSGWAYDNWTKWDALTIPLPPVGDPDGEKKEYAVSYILGTGMLTSTKTTENEAPDGTSHWDLAAWATNYYMPAIPIYEEVEQHFLNTLNFEWPMDHPMFSQLGHFAFTSDFLGLGLIEADLDNPKDGATVRNN